MAMLAWKRRKAPAPPNTPLKPSAPASGGESSALLGFIAGEFAADIAHLWPAPHSDFLLAPSARRHLACMALAVADKAGDWTPGPGLARDALRAPLREAIRTLTPGAPPGLARALGRLGEAAWKPADYGLLLTRLADPHTAKVLRHAQAIQPRDVRILSTLPTTFVEAGGSLVRLTQEQSVLLAECFSGIVRRDGVPGAAAVAQRWAKAPDATSLFRLISADLTPSAATPPHPGTANLIPIATRDGLSAAGRRYRNCLDGRVLDGWNHYYEWLGPPGAVVCISRDHLFGWSLDEALGVGNTPLERDAEVQLKTELSAIGIHVGRDAWTLRRLTREHAAIDS